jgi:hypothetical protein
MPETVWTLRCGGGLYPLLSEELNFGLRFVSKTNGFKTVSSGSSVPRWTG